MADEKPADTGPTDEQKTTIKGLVKEALNELIAEREEKSRTGKPAGEKPKGFFETLGFG